MGYSLSEAFQSVSVRRPAANPFRYSTKYFDDDVARERGDGEAAGFVPAPAGTEEAGALRATTRQTGLVYQNPQANHSEALASMPIAPPFVE